MGEKGNPLASMTDIPDYIASLSAAYTVYKDSQQRKEDRAEREVERAQIAQMESGHEEAETRESPMAPPPPEGGTPGETS
jgi:cation transport regulator ChaB